MKTKFNNVVHKEIFYPGAKIIAEGGNNQKAYCIVDGTVNVQCKKSAGSKFTDLLYQQDPTRARRDAEQI